MKDIIMQSAADKIQLYGLRKFTMDEIAEELKISKKTIYKYFSSKDDIVIEYFREIIETDKASMLQAMETSTSIADKLNSIICSYHKYRLPIKVLDEASKFYRSQWEDIEKLRRFKLELVEKVIKEGMEAGTLKNDINISIISSMLESISSTFLDYEFLSKNGLTMKEAMEEVMRIVLDGIRKKEE